MRASDLLPQTRSVSAAAGKLAVLPCSCCLSQLLHKSFLWSKILIRLHVGIHDAERNRVRPRHFVEPLTRTAEARETHSLLICSSLPCILIDILLPCVAAIVRPAQDDFRAAILL